MREEHPPVGQVVGKKQDVASMFDAIAPRYDLLNRLLSFGIDKLWRRRAINLLKKFRPREILDVATGTADLAVAAARLNPERIVGVDIAEEMLRIGRLKVESKGLSGIITLENGDSENLPFVEDSFDAALVAFGVRNFEDLELGLKEICRVLRPGGALVVLEFSRPTVFPVKQLFDFYFRKVLPGVGRTVSGVKGPYTYLPESVQVFPDGQDFLDEMGAAGFSDLSMHRQTFGIATIYKGIV